MPQFQQTSFTEPCLPLLSSLLFKSVRVSGGDDREADDTDSNDFLRKVWGDKVFIAAGGYTPQTAVEMATTKGGLIAFGRHYIANPDLPFRLKYGVPLTKYQRSTFYTVEDPHGYIDYPTATLPQLTGSPSTVAPDFGLTTGSTSFQVVVAAQKPTYQ